MVNYCDKYLHLRFFCYLVLCLLIVSSVRADDSNDLDLQATSNTPQDTSLVTDATDSTLNINVCNGEKCTNGQAFATEESSTVSYTDNDNSLENESSTLSVSTVAVTETTVNISDGVSVNTTTHKVLVNVSTTSSPVTTTTSGDKKFKSPADAGLHYCDCDIMRNECDINCCCDKDCSEQDRLVFTYCLPPDASAPLPSKYSDIDNRHCYTSHFIYLNNTKMLDVVEHAAPGLFCIAINNLPAEVMYKYYPLVKSVNQFNKVLKSFRKKFYFWPQTPVNESLCDTATDYGSSGGKSIITLNSTEYKFGDYIQYFTNGSSSLAKKYLSVPVKIPSLSLTSSMCNGDIPLQYLKDYSSSCLRKSPDTKDDCESILKYIDMYYYYNRDLKVLAVPHLFNSSAFSYSDCPEDICIGVVPSVCVDDNFEICYDNVILRPTFNIISDVCMNAVDKLQYVVYHNGSQGIIKIDINFHLTNISLINKHQMFRQYFQVRYSQVINNVTFTTAVPNRKPLIRSGTPGYLPGKPIISGRKIVNIDMDMNEHMEMNDDPNYWLTIPKTKMTGHCDENKNNRLNVVFLQNIKSECLLRLPSSCDPARNKSREILLGENAINLTDVREANIYVSSFGDPNLRDFNSWVPVLIDVKANPATGRFNDVKNRKNKCPNAFTDINYKILFSYTSVVKRPQAKIIGVLMSLSSSSFFTEESLTNKRNESLKLVKITSTVIFVDVTRPEDVIVRFADPPVYEIKLPPDFFYPFLSNSNRISTSFVVVWLCFLGNFYVYV